VNPLAFHKVWGHFEVIIYEDGTILATEPVGGTVDEIYILHGYLLYVAWGLLLIVQLSSVRYLKWKWRWNMWLHGISGSMAGIISIVACWNMLTRFVKLESQNPHIFQGFIFLFACNFMICGGIMNKMLN